MEENIYSDPPPGNMLAERRSGADRRSYTSISAHLARQHRRRKSRGRRKTDGGAYVDIYDARTWRIVIGILILSLMDALLTGLHLIRGSARELNPILNAVIIRGGLPAFFSIKALMTIPPMAVIMLHKEWALGKYAARLCLWSYILLSIYHMYLIFGVHRIEGFFLASGM